MTQHELTEGTIYYYGEYALDRPERYYFAKGNLQLPGAPKAVMTEQSPSPEAAVQVVWTPDTRHTVPAVDSKIAFAAKKVPLFAVTLRELFGIARVKAYGGKKHGWGNYLKACLSDGAGDRYVAAGMRHLQQMQNDDGTWDAKSLSALDEESGLPHIDHLLCSFLMLRGILVKDGVLKLDPGEGNEPPKAAK